jgi:hypothetical protein
MYALNRCAILLHLAFALVLALVAIFVAQPVFAGTPCKADEHTGYGPESEVPSDNDYFPHMFVTKGQVGAFYSKRYCHDEYSTIDVVQLFAFGKTSGRLVRSDTSRDLQIFDEDGRIRIIETKMESFSREMIFDEKGALIFFSFSDFSGGKELVVPKDVKIPAGPRSPEEDVNYHLLTLYSAKKFPKPALQTWLLQYHGEGPGMTLEGQIREWKAAHPEDFKSLLTVPFPGRW